MSPTRFRPFLLLLASFAFFPGCRELPEPPGESASERPPGAITFDAETYAWAEATLQHLTLEQKVSQLFAVPAPGGFAASDSPAHREVTELVRDLQVGGVIFFQGSPLDQAAFVNQLQRDAPIPLLVSQDMETGAGMRLTGATRLPSAMSLAASRDPDLVYQAGRATAAEARAVGVRHVLAPVADVNANSGNPVIDVRSFSDRPGLAAVMVDAFVRGLQDGGVLATAKHFPGHGSTSRDSHFSMPVLEVDFARIDSVDLVPFRAALAAGAASVMTAHVAFPQLDGGLRRPATLSPPLVHGLLRDSLGFDGLIVSDALNMQGVRRGTPASIALDALRAGVDQLMMSTDVIAARRSIIRAVERGEFPVAELDARVRRILVAKAAAGLHRERFTPLDDVRTEVANAAQRALAVGTAIEGLTLLGRPDRFGIEDRPGRDLFLLALSDREDPERHFPFRDHLRARLPNGRMETILGRPSDMASLAARVRTAAAAADDVVIAVYATASSWRYRQQTAAAMRSLVSAASSAGSNVHLVVFGTPYVAEAAPTNVPTLLAYGDGPAEQQAAADGLTLRADIGGRTPVRVSDRFPFGSGSDLAARFPREVEAAEAEMDGAALDRVGRLIREAIDDRAFPGAAVAVGRPGQVALMRGFGTFTYESDRPVTPDSEFDLASLTKVIATTTAVMQLYEAGEIVLDAPVAQYVPQFARNGKEAVTVLQLLTHTGGLTPFRPFYSMGLRSRGRVLEAIYEEELAYEPGTDSRYSDFGPIMLAEMVERISGLGFATYAQRHIFEPLGMWETGYRPVGRGADENAVPTELDGYFRYRLLQGEVHDENAWIMGGVAGHAGLFSSLRDLTRFADMIVSGGRVGSAQFVQSETIRLFTTAADSSRMHTRALGWDTKSPEGYSSAGQYFGPMSFGHTGFTGTSIWFDPDASLYVILLANRVYPTRNNRGHIPVRPALADLVHETLTYPGHVHAAD